MGRSHDRPIGYGFNFGAWFVHDPATEAVGDGAFTVNRGTRPADFRDGLSSTLAVAEVKAYRSYIRNTDDPGPSMPATSALYAGLTAQLKLGPNTNIVLLMDGSSRSVADGIDLSLWRALGTRTGNEVTGQF